MKVYRPKLKVSVPNADPDTYHAPFVTLFPSHLCRYDMTQQFIDECKFLYISRLPLISLFKDVSLDDVECSLDYKSLEIHPLRDIWNRIKVKLGYGF